MEDRDMFAELDAECSINEVDALEIVRAPFGYPGGKNRSIRPILQRLPHSERFVDVFGGSGIITLNKSPTKFDVYNDRFSGVTAFYTCMNNSRMYDALIEKLDLTIHSKEYFKYCKVTWEECDDIVERAFRWYYMVEYSFGCLGRNWGSATTTGLIAGKIRRKLPRFPIIHARFKNVQVDNDSWEKIFDRYDKPGTVMYIDPPYIDSSKGIYKHELSQDDHRRLINRIMSADSYCAVSGYSNPLYENQDWDDRAEWDSYISIEGNGNNKKEHERTSATEVLWVKDYGAKH